ncbi:host specificity protein J [Pseudomonas oryzihabitans]|uniref:Host specificity protein J n=1 Tax=Pseudomonas oryzihabitans TaxID=47885 RepID=A0A0U4W3V1_9PSED|nr:DUF1983 domain-containing protein [Pseudomonas oryzihabitans]ALZ84518.1 host specificity protein J [Pseudomonas oryzihabitans]
MGQGVSKVAQVAIGAVVGFMSGGPWGAAIGAGLALYSANQQAKLNTDTAQQQEPSAQTVRSSKAACRYLLGRVSTGGLLAWAQEQKGPEGDGEWLHLVYVLAEGAIAGVDQILLGEEDINAYGDSATFEVVINPTQPNAFLLANCPDWKDSQIGRGLSFVRLSLRYSAERFPSGIPDVRFIVRGRTDIYDPRNGITGYSENTALHLLWYLRARCNVPDDEIVFPSFADGANVSEEVVSNADGTSSSRYVTSCAIGADEQRTQVLQKLEQACGGQLVRVGGKWSLQVGAYYGPYDFTITEDMVIGTVSGSTEVSNDSAINIIRGTFMDPAQAWADTDYPEVRIAEWVAEDGGEAAETLSFSYITDPYQAQRLANMELRRRRAGGTLSIPLNFNGYNCRPGRVVRVNLPSLNIDGEFIVQDWTMTATGGCTVNVSQYDAEMFGDAVGKPYNPIGFISLPTGGIGTPTGLTWTPADKAEVSQGVLSWVAPTQGSVQGYVVTVRQGAKAVQSKTLAADSLQISFNDLPAGNYTMSVAAVGPLARSGEVSITVSIDGPPIPEKVAVYANIDAITLVPSNPLHGLNGGTYEYWFSTDPKATADKATFLGQGLSFTHTGLAFYSNYYYFIRTRNAYGVSAFLKVNAATSQDVGAILNGLTGKITKTQLGGDLLKSVNSIDSLVPLVWTSSATYKKGQIVAYTDGRLYSWNGDKDGNETPPGTKWVDAGQGIAQAGAVAAQVNKNTQDISTLDGRVKAQAESVNGLVASISPVGAGDADWGAGDANVYAGTITVQSVAANDNLAQARRIDTVESTIGQNAAAVQVTQEAIVQQGNSLNGLATRISSSYSIKTEITANGQRYAAGIALGVDYSGGDVMSQFLVMATRFAVLNTDGTTVTSPFVVQGGQTIINVALIGDGTITNAKIGNTIQSNDYVEGQTGWRLNKNGSFEINGSIAGEGRLNINNVRLTMYDENNRLRLLIGRPL